MVGGPFRAQQGCGRLIAFDIVRVVWQRKDSTAGENIQGTRQRAVQKFQILAADLGGGIDPGALCLLLRYNHVGRGPGSGRGRTS